MNTAHKLGVWIDHQEANLIEYAGKTVQLNSISRDEQMSDKNFYFLRVASIIQQYDEVVLFGRSDAKAQLFNLLNDYSLLFNTKIDLYPTAVDMTENQKHLFVKEYFNSFS